jgi:hypothetical protein
VFSGTVDWFGTILHYTNTIGLEMSRETMAVFYRGNQLIVANGKKINRDTIAF